MTMRDVSSCKTYNYGDALYWDARYVQEGESLFDWYQRYSALRPFIRNYIPSTSSPVLVVGCGNAGWRICFPNSSSLFLSSADRLYDGTSIFGNFYLRFTFWVMSEDMAKDGYEDIMNIDISSVAINMMKTRNKHIPQLKYKQMDVRDMSFFLDESFDGIIDKGTLDSLMCGNDAPISAAQMLGEVSRLLKPGGVYILITYGDPKVRMPHLSRPLYDWNTILYIQPRPGFQRPDGCSSSRKSYLEPVPVTANGFLPAEYVMEDPDSHFIYVCKKKDAAELLSLYRLRIDDLL